MNTLGLDMKDLQNLFQLQQLSQVVPAANLQFQTNLWNLSRKLNRTEQIRGFTMIPPPRDVNFNKLALRLKMEEQFKRTCMIQTMTAKLSEDVANFYEQQSLGYLGCADMQKLNKGGSSAISTSLLAS